MLLLQVHFTGLEVHMQERCGTTGLAFWSCFVIRVPHGIQHRECRGEQARFLILAC